MAVRLVAEDREFVGAGGEELHTDLGVLTVPEEVTPGQTVETHLGHPFDVRALRPTDFLEHFERSGAPMLPRDVGLVIGLTGVQAGDRVLDIGTGTGVLAATMARCGADVLTYERDSDASTTARDNFRMADVAERVTVRAADARPAIEGGELGRFDVLTLDTGDAPTIAAAADRLLTPGGYLAAYSPFIEPTREIVEAARESIGDVRALDTIQRPLDIEARGTRPGTGPVGHTGFLVTGRRH